MKEVKAGQQLEDLEIRLLLEAVFHHYGYDFRNYKPSNLRRRVRAIAVVEKVATISALQGRLLHDPACMARFVSRLPITVSSMFRDPSFYRALREQVLPRFRNIPFVRIWLAGCATGEEVYSMAILLKEEGLYDRCRIYATDMNQQAIRRAREGIYPLAKMRDYTQNYLQSAGKCSFSEYYTAGYDNAIFSAGLRENVVFSMHNLVTDGPFNEFHLILCRNVMIYFNQHLKARVIDLFTKSLGMSGILGLGSQESLCLESGAVDFEAIDGIHKLYQKVR
jgi:chemotaxis protein methyltransferase CheR